MPSATPVFAFPYPLGTDRVMDGDDAIAALANKVEAVKAVKTVLPAPVGGVGIQDADGCSLYRLPGFCLLRLFCFNTGAVAANTVFNTIPAGLRPVVRSFGIVGFLSGGVGSIPIDIDPGTGQVKVSVGLAAGGIWAGTVSYPIA